MTQVILSAINDPEFWANSGSAQDIQNAVDECYAAGGGNVMVPSGDFTFNPPAVANSKGVTVPIGINIFGAGKGVTILRESIDVAFVNGVKTYMFYLGWTPDTSKTNRISGISFLGHVDSDGSDKVGIYAEGRKDIRIDHCGFEDFPSQGVYVRGCRGVIDHCDFDNPYKDRFPPKSDPNGQPWALWGYGIIVIGGGLAESWIADISTLLGVYDMWNAHSPMYIEDCTFTRCRHAIASNTNGYYVSRYNHFEKCSPYGQVDVHGGPPGGRGMESYNNTFDLSDESYSFGQDAAFQLRGGGGVVFNNTVIFNPSYPNRSVFLIIETVPPWDIHQLYIWGNTAKYTNGTPVDFNSKIENSEGAILDVDYFLREPNQAQDGFIYTPYVYPHPLVSGEAPPPSGLVTPNTESLAAGTYRDTMPTQVQAGADLYNFKQWEDGTTNPVRLITLNQNLSLMATYELATVILNIVAGTNGSVSPVGSQILNVGQSYQFQATANPGYTFDHWDLAGTNKGSSNPLNITATLDMNGQTLTAMFTANPVPQIALNIAVEGDGITDLTPGAHTFNVGDTISIAAIPQAGVTFIRWTLNDTIYIDNPLPLLIAEVMDGQTLTAVFTTAPTPAAGPPDLAVAGAIVLGLVDAGLMAWALATSSGLV